MKSMKAIYLLLLLLLLNSYESRSQNLIGYKIRDIQKYMKENQKSMVFQNLTFNNTFRYLKYVNRAQTQTLFFFLSADSVCRSVRLVCDKELRSQKIAELNSKYKPVGENKWEEEKNGQKYIIDLKDDEWTFNISINIKPVR
ncbi:MAG TPA: hypothetical protein PL101_02475 [Bacteroidales bacterium]|nr:hypothetical protein [Bacteroidales bacterium]